MHGIVGCVILVVVLLCVSVCVCPSVCVCVSFVNYCVVVCV